MRRGRSWATLATLIFASCSSPSNPHDMIGYVPPTSLPAQPKRTMVRDRPVQVWNNLMTVLQRSAFELDHADIGKHLIIARYFGDPEPYLDCGSIVTRENGVLAQVAGAAENVRLSSMLDARPVILNRALDLESRIIIRLEAQPRGTVISTDTTYTVTKAVEIQESLGTYVESHEETVRFSAGERKAFKKGTTCQPNGFLDVSILQHLPNISGTSEITRAELRVDLSDQDIIADEFLPEQFSQARIGSDRAAMPNDNDSDAGPRIREAARQENAALSHDAAQAGAGTDAGGDGSIVEETTDTLLETLDCRGVEWYYCEIAKLTVPYRKANIEKPFGLMINTAENFAPQIIGSNLTLDVDLPSFPGYLHVIYAGRGGTINHVVSADKLWPADAIHHLLETDLSIPGPSGLAMIVAFVSEQPLFPSGKIDKEEASVYLDKLKKRLRMIEASATKRQIAASQLLVNVE